MSVNLVKLEIKCFSMFLFLKTKGELAAMTYASVKITLLTFNIFYKNIVYGKWISEVLTKDK